MAQSNHPCRILADNSGPEQVRKPLTCNDMKTIMYMIAMKIINTSEHADDEQ